MPSSQLAGCSLSFPFSAPVFLKDGFKYLYLPALQTLLQVCTLTHGKNLLSAHCFFPGLLQCLHHPEQPFKSNLLPSSRLPFYRLPFLCELSSTSPVRLVALRAGMIALEVTVEFSRFMFSVMELRWDPPNPCNSWSIFDMFWTCQSVPSFPKCFAIEMTVWGQ